MLKLVTNNTYEQIDKYWEKRVELTLNVRMRLATSIPRKIFEKVINMDTNGAYKRRPSALTKRQWQLVQLYYKIEQWDYYGDNVPELKSIPGGKVISDLDIIRNRMKHNAERTKKQAAKRLKQRKPKRTNGW